jgi:hypothetical protein
VAGVAVSCRRMFHNVGYGDAVAGMASRWRGWSHRPDGDGGDRSHWTDVTAPSRAGVEYLRIVPSRVPSSFFEGAVRWPYESGWYSVVGRLLTSPHSVAQWQGVGGVVAATRELAEQCRGMIPRRVVAWICL